MKAIVQLLLLVAFASLGLAADKAREDQVDDIREAVFLWQFDHNASGQKNTAKVYFLEVEENDGDPSDMLIKRFARNTPPVRKRSEGRGDRGSGVFDKRTGGRGVVFQIKSIQWNSDTEVEVEGGYYAGGLNASGNSYKLKKKGGKWKVTNDTMRWIS